MQNLYTHNEIRFSGGLPIDETNLDSYEQAENVY